VVAASRWLHPLPLKLRAATAALFSQRATIVPACACVVRGVFFAVPSMEIVRVVDAVLAMQLRDVVVVSVTATLLAFLRFAVRRQRSCLRDIVADCRTRVKAAREAERLRVLAVQQELEAARRRAEELSTAKVSACGRAVCVPCVLAQYGRPVRFPAGWPLVAVSCAA
jgi:hypothetical protein